MKILYDHQTFSTQKFGGISKYFCELMKNFPTEHQFKLSVLITYNHYLKENGKLFRKIVFPLPDKEFTGRRILKNNINCINEHSSKFIISSNKFDLFHPTFYNDYFFNNLKKPYIITVHDLTTIKFQDRYFWEDSERQQMRKVIKNATRVIAISQNTKKDLIEILNVNSDKIDVVHHGFAKPKSIDQQNLFGQYILFVGLRKGYKNFTNFILAVGNLFRKEAGLKLICVGKPFEREEIDQLKSLGILERTIVLSADEPTLNKLYRNALLFAYPSLYEGFGMPILEAFANDCPVCLSKASCFPEIAGKAGAYFNPNDQESILETLKKTLYDNEYKNQLIFEGNLRLKNFSWKKTADETIVSYRNALSV